MRGLKIYYQCRQRILNFFHKLSENVLNFRPYLNLKNILQVMNEDVIKLESPSNIIKEGKAEILEPPGRKVFYNPVQEFNRDLRFKLIFNVLVFKYYKNVHL